MIKIPEIVPWEFSLFKFKEIKYEEKMEDLDEDQDVQEEYTSPTIVAEIETINKFLVRYNTSG